MMLTIFVVLLSIPVGGYLLWRMFFAIFVVLFGWRTWIYSPDIIDHTASECLAKLTDEDRKKLAESEEKATEVFRSVIQSYVRNLIASSKS